MNNSVKPTTGRLVLYLGSSFKDLLKLPQDVKDVFATGFDSASRGETPIGSKALKGFGGRSVVEIVEDYKGDTYRAVYTVKFKEAIYVLHVFKKKSVKGIATPKPDMDLIEKRLKDAISHYNSEFRK